MQFAYFIFFQQNIEKMLEGKPTQKVFTIFNILEIIWFEHKCATFEPFCAVTLITFWKLISVICQLTGPAGLWLGCGWQILFQGKKRCHLATWTRPATCGRTWDTLLVITWEGMDRNRKQILHAMIYTWKNGKEVPRWGVAEIQKMSPSTTGRC